MGTPSPENGLPSASRASNTSGISGTPNNARGGTRGIARGANRAHADENGNAADFNTPIVNPADAASDRTDTNHPSAPASMPTSNNVTSAPAPASMPTPTPAFPRWFGGSEYMHRVTRAVAQYGPIARTTLAPLLGLSPGALSRITGDLIHQGVIRELPTANGTGTNASPAQRGRLPEGFTPHEGHARRGRPQTALTLCEDARTFIGIKVHGASAIAVTVNARGDIVSGAHEIAFPAERSPEQVTSALTELVHACEADVAEMARMSVSTHTDAPTPRKHTPRLPAPVAVGISVGGHVRDDDTVTYAPFLRWNRDVPLAAMMRRATGLPCIVCNDIDALLVDASWFGPGVGLEAFAVITIGIGVGYSLAMRGQPVTYPDKSYGLLAHVLIDPDGPRCTAGHVGCAQCLTDNALANQYSQMMGRACTFDDFVRDARAGMPQASRLLDRTCFRLGALIATVANVAMPSAVMIAGESAFLAKMNVGAIRDGISRYRHSQASPVRFTVVDHDWRLWAKAAASCAIARYIG